MGSQPVTTANNEKGARVARIDGPSGSGRSTLLAEMIRQAQLAHMTVIGNAGQPGKLLPVLRS